MKIRTIANSHDYEFASHRMDFVRYAFASQFLKCVRFRNLNRLRIRRAKSAKILFFQGIFSGFFQFNFTEVLFLCLNIASKTIISSDNSINLFQAVKFRRIRFFGVFFGFSDKFWLVFDNVFVVDI